MRIDYPPHAFANLIQEIKEKIAYAHELGGAAEVKPELIRLYCNVEEIVLDLEKTVTKNNFSLNYSNQLTECLNKMTHSFSRSYGANAPGTITLLNEEREPIKREQERDEAKIEDALRQLTRAKTFFTNIDFFNRDLVVIGANGSGKTFLAKYFTTHIKGNGILISAERVLKLPTYESIRSYATTANNVKSIQLPNREIAGHDFKQEFGILIEYILSEDGRMLRQNRSQSENPLPPPTKLQRLLMIWNSLFHQIQISLPDDINIEARKDSLEFHISEMSNGEKAVLFLIAHVLLCPKDGIIIIDEPEMHLHPIIHRKLWDRLQSERQDAIFIYVTHDLDFASSRINAKKLWLKSFTFPDQFVLQEIPENEIPKALLMELLGSRQDILFCEGVVGGLDEQVYNVLFPEYTIRPVGGCLSVISFTRAFNKIPMSTQKAIGIIDGDYIPKHRTESLRHDNVFTLSVPDVENILLNESILSYIAKKLSKESKVINIRKRILNRLSKDRNSEVARYVSSKIDYYFKDTNIAAARDLDILMSNFYNFTNKIDVNGWAKERAQTIDEIVSMEDYERALRIYKNKGLSAIVRSVLGIKDLSQKAIEALKQNKSLQNIVKQDMLNVPMDMNLGKFTH